VPRARNEDLKRDLEEEIISGVLKPGERLDEVTLAERFNVSRTPVREALLQLDSMGLVDIRPRRGAVVAAIGLKELLDMFEVMGELEGMCGRLAVRRATDDECTQLERIHAKSRSAVEEVDFETYYACNVEFHETIYDASRNNFLAAQTLALRNRLAPYRRSQLHQNDRIKRSFDEHAGILEAIRRKDSERAEILMRGHLTAQGGTLQDFIAGISNDMLAAANA